MWHRLKLLRLIMFMGSLSYVRAELKDVNILTNFTVNLVRTQQAIIFACNQKDLRLTSVALMNWNQLVYPVHFNSNYTLTSILTHKNHAKTSVIVDCSCNKSSTLLSDASALRYFNKTYQWLLWDGENIGVDRLLPIELDYLGPNAQVTYVNGSNGNYTLWDVHSKGRHLHGPLEIKLIAETRSNDSSLLIHNDIFKLQGIQNRDQFNELTLRGAAVIDQDNITTNEQIETILSRPTKDTGVATFVKYHYELLGILRDRFNFTVNFRNARGWAGRLGNSRFRIGFLGIVMRNEADVGASGAFNRINRFAEFDTIHQSWKFETGFLYRFTPDLDTHGKSGNFLAPFEGQVWLFAVGTLFAVNFIWRLVEWINEQWRFKRNQQQQQKKEQQSQPEPKPNAQNMGRRRRRQQQQQQSESAVSVDDDDGDDDDAANNSDSINIVPSTSTNDKNFINADNETSLAGVSLKTFAAVCQQGMDPLPNSLPSRTIILTIFLFSLVMYNYYTSSVVGGLLSSTAQGPATVAEVVSSPLKLSFEDIGYYKVLFHENKSPTVNLLYKTKVLPSRNAWELPVYTKVDDAIPYLKKGGYAFHCEVLDAYPEIAKLFDADEICDLRLVSGLLETEVFNWILTKQSQYSEIFRIMMCRAREVALVKRILHLRQPKKPPCQALYRVFPINWSGVSSAYVMLAGGYISATLALFVERKISRKQKLRLQILRNA